jgi:hypothetical protein
VIFDVADSINILPWLRFNIDSKISASKSIFIMIVNLTFHSIFHQAPEFKRGEKFISKKEEFNWLKLLLKIADI